MPFRVREILLVSSDYDAFVLEEDGSLSDRLFYEYSELSISWAPRFTHARDPAAALALIAERRFDMVITVARIGGVDAGELSRRIHEKQPGVAVVLLIFDEGDLGLIGEVPATIDRVFQWTGSAGVLIAAIKLIEDQRNLVHDTLAAGVRVILVVEDRPRAYSSFLGLLYPELLKQSGSLIAEGLNDFHRLMRMRARPKIALATSYDEGRALYEKHREFVCALMSDVRIPRAGAIDAEGGFALARLIRAENPDLPVLFQSAERAAAAEAEAMDAWFVDKHVHDFRRHLEEFLSEALGFGDFVFRLPDRTEVARARDVYEMEQVLGWVPAEAVAFHAARNHFSTWLRARSMFALAELIRPKTVAEAGSVDALRRDIVEVLRRARELEQEAVITDLAAHHTGPDNRFVRVGRGSIGGKGRGIGFLGALIVEAGLYDRYPGLQIRIPKTVVLGTDAFDAFIDQLDTRALLAADDAEVTHRVLAAPLPDHVRAGLHRAFDGLKGPLAVRSSSLQEDSRFHPFAGVYATYMLPNDHPDPAARFEQLLLALKGVYASAYWSRAKNYLAGTPEDGAQKLAVVVQQVVGQRFGTRYYPALSGVAQSYNFYPAPGLGPEQGVAHVALGLGHTVVGGGAALSFCPAAPAVLPQLARARDWLAASQSSFFALDLARADIDVAAGPEASLVTCSLEDAERDGALALAGSVYSGADDVIRDNLALPGPRVVTFRNLLVHRALPFAQALADVVELARRGVGEEVEIEIALDAPPRAGDGKGADRPARLYLLQLRPMTSPDQRSLAVDLARLPPEAFLCRSERALGHGSSEVRDVVFVAADRLDVRLGIELVERVRVVCQPLAAERRPFLLIGPGRWGSADPLLGVGVAWSDIAGARAIVETPLAGRHVEPSQGTHFFRNITAARVGYLTVDEIDRAWLNEAWTARGGDPAGVVRHLRFDAPLAIHLDGRRGSAAIVKPAT